MGQFSWLTADTKEQISSEVKQDVVMLDDKGNEWHESEYEGYGEFGGKDFYELLAEMNGMKSDRSAGISLAFGSAPFISPKLVFKGCKLGWHSLPDNESDPDQGWGASE